MRNRLKIEKLQDVLDGNRITWFGHVMRMQDTGLPKKIFTLKLLEGDLLEDQGQDGEIR